MNTLETLKQFLRIPSVSTDPERAGDVRHAARFVANLLRDAGLNSVAEIEAEGRHPLVYGEWLHAPEKPTLLFYGHYDVQPPEPLEEWISPPFEPEVRGDNIYARGAADDKGLSLILIAAIERVLRNENPPVNIRVLMEGEEETGGEHVEEFVRSNPEKLRADAAVIADTEMFAPELPTICVGLRGIVYGEIHVQTAEQDLHSGMYGGAAANAVQAAAEVIAALKDRGGRIQIPGFLDRVRQPSPQERDAWNRLPFNEDAYLHEEMRAFTLTGETDVPLFDRLWARPTFEVHGIRGGFIGEGAKTVIPARAVVKVSCRLVPDQDPAEATQQLEKAIQAATPKGCKASFQLLSASPPSMVDPDNKFVRAAADAMTEVFGNKTVFTRSGGSIPVVSLFQQHLGIPSVMLGYGLPDDNLHAPNEKLYLPNFFRGIEATVRFLEKCG